jgi:hypothetical protein
MKEKDTSPKFKQNPDIVTREEDGDALLFNPKTGAVKLINKSGLAIWNLCEKGAGLADAVSRLSGAFPGTDPAIIEKDASEFFDLMSGLGLIVKT